MLPAVPIPRPRDLSGLSEDEIATRFTGLRNLSFQISSSETVEDVCMAISSWLGTTLGAPYSIVALQGPQAGRVTMFGGEDGTAEESSPPPDILEEVSEAVRLGFPSDRDEDEDFPGMWYRFRDDRVDCVVADPLDRTGQAAGAIIHLGRGAVDPEDEVRIRLVMGMCGSAVRRAWAIERVGQLAAVTDSMLGGADIGFAFLDRDLRFVHVNDRLAEMNGRPLAEHLGRTIREVVPELADNIEEIVKKVIESGVATQTVEISLDAPGARGERQVREARYFPVRGTVGDIIGAGAIVEDITDRKKATEDLERRYDHEREVANRLREGILPDTLDPPPGYSLASRYAPGAEKVGGDWYDVIDLGDGRFSIVIGDATGHGLDAALAMVKVRHALVGLAHAVEGPGDVVVELDGAVREGTEDQLVATLVYAILEAETGVLSFCSAGHPPPVHVTAEGEASPLVGGRSTPLGIEASSRRTARVVLEPGDSLILFTDGLLERRDETADAGLRRLLTAATGVVEDVDELAGHLVEQVADPYHDDDLAVVVLRRDPA